MGHLPYNDKSDPTWYVWYAHCTMATSYDHITDAVMGEAAPEKAGFLQELIENQLEMSSLETAASRAGIAQSSALWALGIMMVSDVESVRDAAFDRARDNPLDAALVAICGPTVDLAKSAAYFLTGFIVHKAVKEPDVQAIGRMVDAVSGRWLETRPVREQLIDLVHTFSQKYPVHIPLHAAMQLFCHAETPTQLNRMAIAVGEVSVKSSRAAGVAESRANPFLAAVEKQLRLCDSVTTRKNICWMLSNLACDTPWADWIVDADIHRALIYVDPATVADENIMALSNIVDGVKSQVNMETLQGTLMLRYVLYAHTGGRFTEAAAGALCTMHNSLHILNN